MWVVFWEPVQIRAINRPCWRIVIARLADWIIDLPYGSNQVFPRPLPESFVIPFQLRNRPTIIDHDVVSLFQLIVIRKMLNPHVSNQTLRRQWRRSVFCIIWNLSVRWWNVRPGAKVFAEGENLWLARVLGKVDCLGDSGGGVVLVGAELLGEGEIIGWITVFLLWI